jgi:maleate isomerase
MTGQPTRLERQSRRSPQAYVRAAPTRMGVLVPWANTTVEDELHLWSDRTAWHYARLAPASGTTALADPFLQGLVDAIPDALFQLSALPLQRIYLACTSAAFTRPDQLAALSASGRVPVVSAFHAIVTYLNSRRLTRITLATPYPQAITEVELSQFAAHGITVLDAISLGLTDGYADITTQQITEPALEMAGKSGGDALVLSCTGWPTRAAVSILRDQLDRPVISSNSAIAAHALRGQP